VVRGSDPIVGFYSGARDAEGRTLEEVLSWDDNRLEAVHDYIQWVFPTRQPSGVNPDAPLIDDGTVRAFADAPVLREGLLRALDRMLAFYGLRRTATADGAHRVDIDRSRFRDRATIWLHPGNHNHLRLTRIMESLSTLGLRAEAAALQRCLTEDVSGEAGDRITTRTLQFWQRAVR
jgi:hypothetical protein